MLDAYGNPSAFSYTTGALNVWKPYHLRCCDTAQEKGDVILGVRTQSFAMESGCILKWNTGKTIPTSREGVFWSRISRIQAFFEFGLLKKIKLFEFGLNLGKIIYTIF